MFANLRNLFHSRPRLAVTTTDNTARTPEGAPQASLEDIPNRVHASQPTLEEPQAQCSICLSHINTEASVEITCDSRHRFHRECVREWLTVRSTCPLDQQQGVRIDERSLVQADQHARELEAHTSRHHTPSISIATTPILSDHDYLRLAASNQQNDRERAIRLLRQQGRRTLEDQPQTKALLQRLVGSSQWQSRRSLAKALRYYTGSTVNISLLTLAADSDNDVGEAALTTIKRENNRALADDAETRDRVFNLTDQPGWKSRQSLAKALNYYSAPMVNLALLILASDSDNDVCEEARTTIAEGNNRLLANDYMSQDRIISLTQRSSWKSCESLAKALRYYSSPAVNLALLMLASDADIDVCEKACNTIGRQNNRNLPDGADSRHQLIDLTLRSSWKSRQSLAQALKYYVGETVNLALLSLSADSDLDVCDKARETIASNTNRTLSEGATTQDYVVDLTNRSSWKSRESLAKTLRHYSGPISNLALLILAADSDQDVQESAYASIRKLRHRTLTENNTTANQIEALTRHSSWKSRQSLAKSLSYYRGNMINQMIEILINDQDSDVRDQAMLLLNR